MKKIFYFSIVIAFFLAACKKDPQPIDPPYILNAVPSNYLSVVQKYVRQHPAFANYNSINFDQYRVSMQQTHWYVRLPLNNKSLATDFVLMQTDSLGNTKDGRVIHLEQTSTSVNNNVHNHYYNGTIIIYDTDGQTVVKSNITNGYIEAFHPALFNTNTKTLSNRTAKVSVNGNKEESFPVPIDYDELPEVVVTGYGGTNNADGGLSWSDYMMLQSMFSVSGSGGGGSSSGGGTPGTGTNGSPDYANGIYSPVDYGDGAGIYSTTPPHQDPNVTLTFDESFSRPAIDLNAWMKCFTDIPDAGAVSSITLLGDLPVDGHPDIGLNIWNGNTGHCFLQLNKTNGAQSVTQIIGFTAQSAGKAIINADAFVPSKIVDNAGHKYNCSITMGLGAAGLNMVISTIRLMADMPYSIVNYDCLDFGLDVFNSVRPDPLMISKKFDPNDPFSNIAMGPKLYNLLMDMVDNGSPEAGNIIVGGSRYIGVSHGACQ